MSFFPNVLARSLPTRFTIVALTRAKVGGGGKSEAPPPISRPRSSSAPSTANFQVLSPRSSATRSASARPASCSLRSRGRSPGSRRKGGIAVCAFDDGTATGLVVALAVPDRFRPLRMAMATTLSRPSHPWNAVRG